MNKQAQEPSGSACLLMSLINLWRVLKPPPNRYWLSLLVTISQFSAKRSTLWRCLCVRHATSMDQNIPMNPVKYSLPSPLNAPKHLVLFGVPSQKSLALSKMGCISNPRFRRNPHFWINTFLMVKSPLLSRESCSILVFAGLGKYSLIVCWFYARHTHKMVGSIRPTLLVTAKQKFCVKPSIMNP